MPRLDELELDPFYLSPEEKEVLKNQYLREREMNTVDEKIAEYLDQINQFPFIATIRSCQGHGYPGHISFRFTKPWHQKFIENGIKPLISQKLCHIFWEVGDWLPTKTGLYFRWKARFPEEKRDKFFQEFIRWLKEEAEKEAEKKSQTEPD